jgi:translation initiation factor 2 beta subunit (eIF-2beta)/eIF-5
MSSELVEVRCRSCGSLEPLEVRADERFTLECESCGAETDGRYREDGTIVWS